MRAVSTGLQIVEMLHNAKRHLRRLLETGIEIRTSHFCAGAGSKKILGVKWISYKLEEGETVVEHGGWGLAIVRNDGILRVLFEIVYTRAESQEEPRPEPWYELPSEFILDPNNQFSDSLAMLQSVRQHDFPCDFCSQRIKMKSS